MASVTLYHYLAVVDTDGSTRLGDDASSQYVRNNVEMKFGRSTPTTDIDMSTANWVSQAGAYSKSTPSWNTGTTCWIVGGDLRGYDFRGWAKSTSASIGSLDTSSKTFNYSVSAGSHAACAYYKKCGLIVYQVSASGYELEGGVEGQEAMDEQGTVLTRYYNINSSETLRLKVKPTVGYKIDNVKVKVYRKNSAGSGYTGSALETITVDWNTTYVSSTYGHARLSGNKYDPEFTLTSVDETKVFIVTATSTYDGSFEIPVG